MSYLTDNNGMVMPVSPMYGNGGGGFGGWGDSARIIILLLFAFGGWGGGMGGNNMLYPWMNAAQTTQAGFDQAATASALSGIQTSLTQGFAGVEASSCQRALSEQATAYNNQIAGMNQNFANQQAIAAQLNGINSSLASCCCENRASVADLKATVLAENCADRATLQEGVRDIIQSQTAGTQRILDMMCQDKIDAKNEKISDLQTQLSMAQLAASQNAQTAILQAGQRAIVDQMIAPATYKPATATT